MGPTDIMQELGGASSTAENSDSPGEMQSAFAVDVHRAMPLAKLPSDVNVDLPTLTKAELAELMFEHVGLNKREAKDMVDVFSDEISDALSAVKRSSCPDSVIFSCATRSRGQAATPRLVSK